MKRALGLSVMLTGCALVACVTINVYFPAAEAKRAADEVIEGVWQPQSATKDETSSLRPAAPLARVAGVLLDFLVAPAHAQKADINVNAPGVRKIRASMEARHPSLKPYYDSGAIGLTSDAMIAIRDLALVPLAERNTARKLVADENADRDALYREIAVANGHPEWENDIRETFASQWIARKQSGWYYRDQSGAWKR